MLKKGRKKEELKKLLEYGDRRFTRRKQNHGGCAVRVASIYWERIHRGKEVRESGYWEGKVAFSGEKEID